MIKTSYSKFNIGIIGLISLNNINGEINMFKINLSLIIIPLFLLSTIAYSSSEQSTMSNKTEMTTQYMSDAEITTKVKSELFASKDIKSLSISVVTTKGIVTLSGNVENTMQKKKAMKIASHVKGVKSVKDELVVTTKQ